MDLNQLHVCRTRRLVPFATLLSYHINFNKSKNMLYLFLEGMKWSLQKINSKKVSTALVAVICITFVICSWQKNPAIVVPFPSLEQFNLLSPVVPARTPTSSDETHQQAFVYGNSSVPESREISLSNQDLKEITLEEKECNYAKGKWVAGTGRPLYSGSSCKQWLSPMWACRLMQRTDFLYESFRWQPQGCEMREFTRSGFFRRMQNKTIALVGDSLGRQQFQSLVCMVTGGEMNLEVEDVGKDYGLVKAPGALRPDGWAYRFPSTNTTILYYWSASLCELEPLNTSDPATHFALHLDRPVTFLKQYLPRFDVLVLNTGHHWNRDKFEGNRWKVHARGQPITDGKLANLVNAKNLTLFSIARWVDSHISKHPHLKAFLRTLSPRHFVNGDWNTGGSCDNTIPLAGGSQVLQDGSSDHLAEAAVKGTRVKLLDITALSQLRDDGHISKYTLRAIKNVSDCLHWCLPGIPDAWNEILYAQI